MNTINRFGQFMLNQRGVALPIVLMIVGGLALAGAAAIGTSTGEIGISRNDKDYKSAINIAEAGTADAADAIQGNRDLLPQPMGAVLSNSYRFNVQMTNGSGRYDVTVSLPVVTEITNVNNNVITVRSVANLSRNEIVVIGNTATRYTAKIGAINNNDLTLLKSDDTAFDKPLSNGMLVSKNLINVQSEGQAGTGLTGSFTMTGWRNIANLNANTTPPSGGNIRSTATVLAQYSVAEIPIFDTFSAKVRSQTHKFTGPLLVTTELDVLPYNAGDFTGPIFAVATANPVVFRDTAGNVLASPPAPKVIRLPNLRITNANTIIDNAADASTAACYQKRCDDASATAQLYWVNGYRIEVTGADAVPITAEYDDLTVDSVSPATLDLNGGPVTVTLTASGGASGTFNIQFGATSPGNSLTITGGPITVDASPVATAPTVAVAGNNIVITPGSADSYKTFTVTVNVPAQASANNYNIFARRSNNKDTNSAFLTVGDLPVVSWEQERTTDLRTTEILTSLPDRTAGRVAPGAVFDTHATLFNGRYINDFQQRHIGERSEYTTTYYIHTTADRNGNCLPEDIKIVSKTIVTYMGTRQDFCDANKTRYLFQYETIWNHQNDNGLNGGNDANIVGALRPQSDDADPSIAGLPHKGYYKWVRAKEPESKPLKPEPLWGDREFNSVFNHSARGNFTSAIVNWNIEKVRMIGWSNPPTVFASNPMNNVVSSNMLIGPEPFPSKNWLDATSSNKGGLDNDDISGSFSSFPKIGDPNGFHFNDVLITLFLFNNDPYLMDSRSINHGAAQARADIYRGSDAAVNGWPNRWTQVNNPQANQSSPVRPVQLGVPGTMITATNSGPQTEFEIKYGTANLFFNAANGIPFNMKGVKVETKATAGAIITIGSITNPATVITGELKVESEGCNNNNPIYFDFIGKLVAGSVELEGNTNYVINSNINAATQCLTQGMNFIFLKRESWRELRK